MAFLDIAPSVCAFIVSLFALPSIKDGIKSKHFIIGFISLLLMGFTIYQASENSDTSTAIVTGKDSLINLSNTLLKKIETDSINNASFQKYVKDTFGIDRNGNKAVIYNYNTYKKNIYNFGNDSVKTNESENYVYKLSKNKDTLTVYPKVGVWVKPFMGFDIKLEAKNQNLYQSDGMGDLNNKPVVTEINGIKHSFLMSHMNIVRSRSNPLILDLSGDRSQYIIFGDEADGNKRYLYQNGNITWIPSR